MNRTRGSWSAILTGWGAGIKSVALAAAFLAQRDGSPITERHVLAAARRELAKQGVVSRSDQVQPR